MKKLLFAALFILANIQIIWAQSDYKVVFDLTSKDSLDHKAVLRWLTGISQSSPDAKLAVVMYGQGVNMVTKDRSSVVETVSKFAGNKNISFIVCAAALKNQGIANEQLLPGIEIVPDGIYEIIQKQKDGWGYIKAVR